MKTGDFISIDYIGRVKESGEIFDVTTEKDAKSAGVYNPKISYRPVNIVVGGDFTIKGLDEALKEMKLGEKKKVIVPPEKGFGNRSPSMIRPIPLSNFKNQKIDPTPGSWVNVNGVRGKILSADGGRIRVDFNHPLAGKSLEYEVEIKKQITSASEKVKAIVGFMTGEDEKIDVKVLEKSADISTKFDLSGEAKKKIAELVTKWVEGIEKVRFIDEYGGEK